jgi:hypothetical protein
VITPSLQSFVSKSSSSSGALTKTAWSPVPNWVPFLKPISSDLKALDELRAFQKESLYIEKEIQKNNETNTNEKNFKNKNFKKNENFFDNIFKKKEKKFEKKSEDDDMINFDTDIQMDTDMDMDTGTEICL